MHICQLVKVATSSMSKHLKVIHTVATFDPATNGSQLKSALDIYLHARYYKSAAEMSYISSLRLLHSSPACMHPSLLLKFQISCSHWAGGLAVIVLLTTLYFLECETTMW